jgi:hypothetical protein
MGFAGRLQQLRQAGASLRAIAATLNGESLETPGGAKWTAMQVSRALRLAKA